MDFKHNLSSHKHVATLAACAAKKHPLYISAKAQSSVREHTGRAATISMLHSLDTDQKKAEKYTGKPTHLNFIVHSFPGCPDYGISCSPIFFLPQTPTYFKSHINGLESKPCWPAHCGFVKLK